MRVLIDACLPVQFKDHLPVSGVVRAARELGWQSLKNGDLLEVAQHQFDVVITMDKNIPSLQWLANFAIGLVIVRARSNRLADLVPLAPKVLEVLPRVKMGQAVVVSGL